MTREDIFNDIRISSRIPYITDEKALKLWDFLKGYIDVIHNDEYNKELIVIPVFRILDALSMINQDKIDYCEG